MLEPGNPKLCGDVPFDLQGFVATLSNGATELQEIETLGGCNGTAAPGTTDEQAKAPTPSSTLEPTGSSKQASYVAEPPGLRHIIM